MTFVSFVHPMYFLCVFSLFLCIQREKNNSQSHSFATILRNHANLPEVCLC